MTIEETELPAGALWRAQTWWVLKKPITQANWKLILKALEGYKKKPVFYEAGQLIHSRNNQPCSLKELSLDISDREFLNMILRNAGLSFRLIPTHNAQRTNGLLSSEYRYRIYGVRKIEQTEPAKKRNQ